MTIRKALPFLLCIVIITGTRAQDVSKSGSDGQWTTFETDMYSVNYPMTWGLDTSGQAGTLFLLLSPRVQEDDNFNENINLVTEDLSGLNLSLAQYLDLSKGNIEAMIENYVPLDSMSMTQDNEPCYEVRYTGTYSDYALTFQQRFWIHHEIAYVLTFTAETEGVESYRPIAEKILSSFRLK